MVYHGHVHNGQVWLESPGSLPEGTRVSVRPLGRGAARTSKPKRAPASLYDRLKPVIGKARNLPADMSANHDHYLYGAPKRRPRKSRKARG
jgi:hypothetical protein